MYSQHLKLTGDNQLKCQQTQDSVNVHEQLMLL